MAKGKVQGENGAAALLGVHPNTLRNMMKKLGVPYGRGSHFILFKYRRALIITQIFNADPGTLCCGLRI
ncbi:MAG: hypothetical protein D3926_15525 [Desulfobacteraceae bacterium]|nr:MAG: hypothetical protein D3926_15525 [Desulfobacteraceae bacterium]